MVADLAAEYKTKALYRSLSSRPPRALRAARCSRHGSSVFRAPASDAGGGGGSGGKEDALRSPRAVEATARAPESVVGEGARAPIAVSSYAFAGAGAITDEEAAWSEAEAKQVVDALVRARVQCITSLIKALV